MKYSNPLTYSSPKDFPPLPRLPFLLSHGQNQWQTSDREDIENFHLKTDPFQKKMTLETSFSPSKKKITMQLLRKSLHEGTVRESE